MAQKAWFCGTPGQVIDGIKSIEAKYPGLEDYMIHWAEGLSPAEFEEQLRWLTRGAMPAFGWLGNTNLANCDFQGDHFDDLDECSG